MLIDKPDVVRHLNSAGNANSIYGIDAHPSDLKFATAGGDNCVKIWSLEVLSETDGPECELLATLTWHEKAVNCVRWSHNGRYLASGSDDHQVLLYELQDGPPAPIPFGSNQVPNKETWVRCSMLKSHTMDVQDLAWSPDDRMLATCSIDNSILIWSMDHLSSVMTHPIQHLSGHQGWVKGVAWDPVGKYLSSAGEDKCIIMWRVDTWEAEEKISSPFEDGTTTSHFRRLSWAPDGSLVCGTHAFKSKQNVAALIERKTWTNDVNFVGHRGVVTSARFNQRLLAKTANKEFACCALGGDDCTVSVWLADVSRPVAVIKECFDASVTDLSWSFDGFTLLSASLDGTICVFQFTPDELGTPITPQHQSRLLQQKYGSLAGQTSGCTLVENPLQLELEGQHKQASMDKLAARLTPSNGNASGAHAFTLVAATPKPADTAAKPSVTTLTARPKAKKPPTSTTTPVTKPPPPPVATTGEIETTTHVPPIKRKRVVDHQPTNSNTLLVIPQHERVHQMPEIPGRSSFSVGVKSTEKVIECKVVTDDGMTMMYTSVACMEGSSVHWMDRIPGQAACATGNLSFCAVGTTDGHLYIVSPLGRRLFPPIALGFPFAAIECSAGATPYLLVILTNGDVKTWTIQAKRVAVAASVCGLTTTKSTLIRAMVTSAGQPIVTLAVDGGGTSASLLHSFTYDLAMQCWMRVADESFSSSDFHTHLPSDAMVSSDIPVGTLRRLQNASTHTRSATSMVAGISNAIQQHHITRTHLEHQVAASLALRSTTEYMHWLKVYARHLSHDGDLLRLEEICKEFLGPMSATTSTDTWTSTVLDVSKRELLQTVVLPQMASNRVLQRLVHKYQLLLDEAANQS
ncbi:hypothetical protein H257_00461 [Aphanomyces astaci]|uniref:Protein HIRA n=1 Tax=Aphanomyces astaci TaxID=112090 RepID=W4HD90_APHAT|nr:hypothetical protein H257_00461 [Aphanomyces astaci]ETV89078.1 hypothetical protein H257_00461 [Aphanomyces astaci]|eukprot:XP_009821478.1 hypothetical protein H257_00461 [Aphanomyces astaci]